MFLLVLLAADSGRESWSIGTDLKPLKVCSQAKLTHILGCPRKSADLGARKRHSCCYKAMRLGGC